MKGIFLQKFYSILLDFHVALKTSIKSRALIFGLLATSFEWYDYALFGYFATLIGKQYFPFSNHLSSILSIFAVFASGFAMRPIGAILFGYIGDRLGRKKALIASLFMIAVPTMLLGFLPNYQSIGIYASFGLVIIRLCQGLAVGGNYGGSFIYIIEHAQTQHRGLSGGLAMFGTLGGLLLGSGIATILSLSMSGENLEAFGWRIPFMLGGLSALIGHYIHNQIPELNIKKKLTEGDLSPLQVVYKKHLKDIIKAASIILLDGVGVYILFVFMSTYASIFLKISYNYTLFSNTVSMILLSIVIPIFGWLGDKITQEKILKWASLGFIFLSLPLFSILINSPCFLYLLLLQLSFAIIMGAVYGSLPAAVISSFPQPIRYTACGLAFNISLAIFGGTTPFVVTWLINLTNNYTVPGIILSLVGVIAYIALQFSKFPYKKY